MEEIEIMFDDLSKEKQQELLDAFEISDPKEMNWDIEPVAYIPIGEDSD